MGASRGWLERFVRTRWTLHRWLVVGLGAVVVASVVVWWRTLDRLPRVVTIATAEPGGLYHRLASVLAGDLSRRTGVRVELVTTHGSVQNHALLQEGRADLAILQSTAVPLLDTAVLAPLYPEVAHVIAAKGSGLDSMQAIAGRPIALGPPGSGMRESALQILQHYRIDPSTLTDNQAYFMELEQGRVAGAIVTTGVDNPDLQRLLESGRYDLLPILDAAAISMRRPLFSPFTIPGGLYDERPPVPPGPIETVASTAILCAPADCSSRLVTETLAALYEGAASSVCPR